jgi:tRNA A37 threonylcarbamoyladenosine biosynthesis protein TsaE
VLAVEWPERLGRPITGATSVSIEIAGENERRIVVTPTPSDSSALPS